MRLHNGANKKTILMENVAQIEKQNLMIYAVFCTTHRADKFQSNDTRI